jgi:hypothetical protein
MKVGKFGELLRALEALQQTHFRHVITDDESWFYFECQQASQWLIYRDEIPQRVDPALGTANFMRTAVWGVNGFHRLDLMLSECRFTAQYFVEHVIAPLIQMVFPQGRTPYAPRLNVHLDNCRVHFSKVTEQFSSRINCCMFPTNLIVLIWFRLISCYSSISKLDSLSEASQILKNY